MTIDRRSALQAAAGIGAAVFLLAGCGKKPRKLPPVDVGVFTAQRQDLPTTLEWVATTEGFIDARVRAQVSGNLLSQNFKEGTHVRQGALLFQIDPRPFQAAFDSAKAPYDKAARDKERYIPLAAEAAISKQELDQAVSAYDQTKAEMERARLNLEFTKVTSPIDGIVGVAKAHVGDLVGPAGGELASVVQADPIKVVFSLSEREYLDYINEHATKAARQRNTDAMRFELALADGSVFARKGRFYSTDNQVDQNTGTVRVILVFDNPEDVLRPGQFARVRHVETIKGALVVPQQALIETQGTRQVAVVDEANLVHMRPVQVGAQAGGLAAVTEGLQAGERVVAEGTMKVHDGAAVDPKPYSVSLSTAASAPGR